MCVATEGRSLGFAPIRGGQKLALTWGDELQRISVDVMPMTGGQGVASSNLASPTKQIA
jgi:hypothetical protein